MIYILMAIVFVIGYVAIALEHTIKINKSASALFIAAICWALFVFGKEDILSLSGDTATHVIENGLMHHLGEIAGILFFLLGAMTIVEIIDTHDGFSLIVNKITTTKKSTLLILLSIITFFMSSVLDNLTTSIVMATLIRKLVDDKKDLWLFAGMIIISANAGGAWSPIGDVTTIMLWIGGQVTASNIMIKLLIPSIVCMVVPLAIMSYRLKGNVVSPIIEGNKHGGVEVLNSNEKKLVLFLGLGALLFVPVFKTVTHLPPFLGVLLGLSILWGVTEFLHKSKTEETKKHFSIEKILTKVDTQSILFFLGILLAVAALQSAGQLKELALFLDHNVGNVWVINILIGFLSSLVDNVPLVAGAIGMYSLVDVPQDSIFWELLAYCTGTGGSCLIIGSAAGVAIMGILKIDFVWYLKNISLLAVIGYVSGVLSFWLISSI